MKNINRLIRIFPKYTKNFIERVFSTQKTFIATIDKLFQIEEFIQLKMQGGDPEYYAALRQIYDDILNVEEIDRLQNECKSVFSTDEILLGPPLFQNEPVREIPLETPREFETTDFGKYCKF